VSRTIESFILYRDITGLLEDARGLRMAVDLMVHHYIDRAVEVVAGIEARGFIFGTAVAYELGVGFVPIRKAGKLPGEVVGIDYELEYGTDRMEMHANSIERDAAALLIDDLIATGGTASAAIELIRRVGGRVDDACFVVDLPDLGGAQRLRAEGISVFTLCSFEGD
jgi:adenine phosphoribosyltransferase